MNQGGAFENAQAVHTSTQVMTAAACRPRPEGLPRMEVIEGEGVIVDRYMAHLSDESRVQGRAEILAFPRCEHDVVELLRWAEREGLSVTVTAGRTGVAAGGVPDGGLLISTERMATLSVQPTGSGTEPVAGTADGWGGVCGPGVSLADLNEVLSHRKPPLFFPPNPTETSARVGGMVAANASGSRSYLWGATRRHVRALRVVLASGDVVVLERGQCAAGPDGFEIVCAGGRTLRVPAPNYRMPAIKNAAGYYASPGMDLVDLFIGSEGTLGIVTEATLALALAPEAAMAIQAFFSDEACALAFVRALREGGAESLPARWQIQAIEYYDAASLALLAEKRRMDGQGSVVPETPADAVAAVFVEAIGTTTETEAVLERLAGLIEAVGGDLDKVWAGTEERERKRMAAFRHALPEAVNAAIGRARQTHPQLTKVGTDMAVPAANLELFLAEHRRLLGDAGLRYLIFGHIGDGHLHANVLPRDMDEYRKARAIYEQLARWAVGHGGTISAEHGVGKLKKKLLECMYGPAGIEEMRTVKRALDPKGLLQRGTMFD